MSINWQNGGPSPAIVVHPSAAASLDEAHAAIELWEHYSRKRLDGPQRLAVEHMMATKPDGMWAARTTGRSVSRQNGKGDEIEVVEAWDLIQRGAPIVHTAHEIPTSVKAHMRMVGFLQGHRDLRRKLSKVRSSNSDRSIETINGGVVVYRTRTAGGGRGLDDIARLVVDEAQWVQAEQLASSSPILAVSPNPQLNALGSAGVEGRSDWWWGLRKRALAGDGEGFAWLENSAELVSLLDGRVLSVPPNPLDRGAWSTANFAYPGRISADYLFEQLNLLGPQLFAREHLNVWDPFPDGVSAVFSAADWQATTADRTRPDGAVPVFFLDVSPGMRSGSVGVAFDGPHVELADHRSGTDWLVARAVELKANHPLARFAIEAQGAVGSLLPELAAAGIEPQEFTGPDMGRACGHLQKLIADRAFTHSDDALFATALAGAVPRDVGEGLWAWGRRKSSTDISPLVALTGALWAHRVLDLTPADVF